MPDPRRPSTRAVPDREAGGPPVSRFMAPEMLVPRPAVVGRVSRNAVMATIAPEPA